MAVIAGDDSDNILDGTDEADGIRGHGGDDTIDSGWGDDTIDGGLGADLMIGGIGDDSYFVDDADDVIQETWDGGFFDLVRASASYVLADHVEDLILTGSAAIAGTGNAEDNRIFGNEAGNRLDGGAGGDRLIGRGGNDTYVITDRNDTIIEMDGDGSDVIETAFSMGSELQQYIENVRLIGTAISAYGNSSDNRLFGNGENNFFDGFGGIDLMRGYAGNDTYSVSDQGDRAFEIANGGTDTVNASIDYRLGAHIENLNLSGVGRQGTGNDLDNRINGTTGEDRLDGGDGADTMIGGNGNDVYLVDHASDVTTETFSFDNHDRAISVVSYTLSDFVEDLFLRGGAENGTGNAQRNIIRGNGLDNILEGLGNNDRLFGGDGDDSLHGGEFTDYLMGGGGSDGFYFDTFTSHSYDRIADFTSVDDAIFLDRSLYVGIAADGTLDEGAFHLGTAAGDADDRILYDASTGSLYYDSDGTGSSLAMRFAALSPGAEISHADFIAYS